MTKVTHDTTAERYLITVDGRDAGYADYIQGDGRTTSTTPSSTPNSAAKASNHSSRPHSTILRAAGDKVRPPCSAVAGFIEKHPEYQDLVQLKCNNPGPPV